MKNAQNAYVWKGESKGCDNNHLDNWVLKDEQLDEISNEIIF